MSSELEPRTSEHEPRTLTGASFSRRTLLHGAAWAAPVVAVAVASAPALAASPGCLPSGTLFNSIARGRILSGSLLGVDLDNIAQVSGVEAQELAGGEPSVTSTRQLTAEVLNSILANLNGLGSTLSDVLQLAAPAQLGALHEYAYAHENGDVVGASGAVGENGVLSFNADDVPDSDPVGTLDLRTILTNLTGSQVSALLALVAELELQIGAVAGRTQFNSLCFPPNEDPEQNQDLFLFQRQYLLAYLRVVLSSPTIGALVSTINSTLNGLTSALVETLNAIPLLGLVADVRALSLSIDTSPTPEGSGHPLQIALSNPATVTVDLGSLLGLPNENFNGLSPNTRLFADVALPTDALATEVGALVEGVLDAIVVDIELRAALGIVTVRVTGSLADVINGTAEVEPSLAGLTGALLATIGTTIKEAIIAAGALTPLTSALNEVLAALFDVLTNVLVLTVNAQNNVETSWIPNDMAAITSPNSARYDVAALHVGAVNALDVLDIFLARGSGGENTPR